MHSTQPGPRSDEKFSDRSPSMPTFGVGHVTARLAIAALLWTLTSLAIGGACHAQVYIFGNASFPTGLRPSWVMTGDFNHDGIMDLAAVNQFGDDKNDLSNGSVSVLLGKPDGTFQSRVEYPTAGLPRFGVVGDFDGDGIQDLAIANLGSASISILRGNGDGTFQAHQDYTVGSGPLSIVAGDFNGDGKLDLAVANSGSNSISVLLGNGDGTFRPHTDFAMNFAPQSVASADLNGDGKLDLIVAEGDISVLTGNGDGTFKPPVEFPGAGASFVTTTDLNGDGKADVVATGFGDNVQVLLGKGNGTFQAAVSYEVGGGGLQVQVADVNGDGRPDLVVGAGAGGGGTNQSGTLSVLLNKGDGTFQTHRDYGGMTAVSLAVADFNGDGHSDVAIPNRDLNALNVMLGDGQGRFGSLVDVITPVPATQIVSGDFNGDGKLDLGMAMNGSGSVGVALNAGSGTFKAPQFDNVPGGGSAIAAGDFTGDGKLDLATFVGSELQNLQILPGNEDGTFKPRISSSVPNNPGELVAGDLNGDGKQDLIVAGFGCQVLTGNADGTFSTGISLACGQSASALLADFNGDGKPDLAVADSGSNTITVFLGVGNATFLPGAGFAAGDPPSSPVGIVAADFNGDGKADLAVANPAGNSVAVLMGNGDGTFQAPQSYSAVQGANSVAAADLDGDGKTDLLVTGNGISILLGNGNGTFQPHVDYLNSIDVRSAIAADFVGDGHTGVAVANLFESSVSAIRNEPAMALRPSELTFPSQVVGTTSLSQSITIYNPGIRLLSVQGASTTGDFSERDSCAGAVKPGTSCVVNVNFQPTAGGMRSGALTIRDDALGNPQVLPLAGTGADFSLAAATGANCPSGGNCSATTTVTAGSTGTYDLQVTPLGGFSGMVSLSCSGQPAMSVCAASPTQVNLNGTDPVAFAVSVSTSASGGVPTSTPRASPVLWLPVLCVALVLAAMLLSTRMGDYQLARARYVSVALLLVVAGFGVVGCSSGSHNHGTPRGTYALTVSGVSGGLSHSVSMTLNVR